MKMQISDLYCHIKEVVMMEKNDAWKIHTNYFNPYSKKQPIYVGR